MVFPAGLFIAGLPDFVPRDVEHRPENEEIVRIAAEEQALLVLEISAVLARESAVAGTLPVIRLERVRHFTHFRHDTRPVGRARNSALHIRMESEEPGQRLILAAEGIVADAVRAEAAHDHALHGRHAGRLQKSTRHFAAERTVRLPPQPTHTPADGGEIRTREHRSVLDGRPPPHCIRTPLRAVLRRRDLADVVQQQAVRRHELLRQNAMRLLKRRLDGPLRRGRAPHQHKQSANDKLDGSRCIQLKILAEYDSHPRSNRLHAKQRQLEQMCVRG